MAASDRIFVEMMASLERVRSKVKELIRDQEKTAVAHAERLQRSLEEQIAQLERRNAELEELSSADDVHFIQVQLIFLFVCFSTTIIIIIHTRTYIHTPS